MALVTSRLNRCTRQCIQDNTIMSKPIIAICPLCSQGPLVEKTQKGYLITCECISGRDTNENDAIIAWNRSCQGFMQMAESFYGPKPVEPKRIITIN